LFSCSEQIVHKHHNKPSQKKKKKKKKKKKQQKKGLMSVIGTTTIGGNEKMGMLPLWLVETVYLARLCADRFAL
jgi:hypothetical protein